MDHIEGLERLARLKSTGVLTEEEFEAQKSELLRGAASTRNSRQDRTGSQTTSEQTLTEFRGSTKGWLFGSFSGWFSLLLIFLYGFGLIIIALKWLKNVGARYELTDQRLMVRRGIILKRVDEIELFRIKDIRVDFSLLNQITDIGAITVRSSDVTSGGRDFVMQDIPNARDIRENMRNLVDEARRRRGVREVDFDHRYV